jgi:hypothetical protein
MGFLPYSLEIEKQVLADIKKQTEREFAHKIISRFNEEGLIIKVKHMFPKKPPRSFYRVFCFIRKNCDTVVIDAKKDCGINIYIRIENLNTFNKLSDFTDNIRNQILNAKECNIHTLPRGHECEGKRYVFSFENHKYLKCKNICSNFCFNDLNKNDFANIMDIINSEIDFIINKNKK